MSKRGKSIFDMSSLEELHTEIQEVYLGDEYPWVIGYSGGKDSTATLQLVWYAIADLPPDQRHKHLYVIASDTLVESPAIVQQIDETLARIRVAAEEQAVPFSTEKVVPDVSETFWVNLIGRGYPAPSQRFRWCTDRMKIRPANRFVLDRAAQYGEVVMILGARKDESMSRAQVMSNKTRLLPGSRLKRHASIARAYVYTPIEEFTADDVWTYLLQVPSPWGDNNRDLAAMYRTAQAGECPLVIDDTTPSCGNSRFGCWVCTVVERDQTMEAMIDSGEDWMEPLLEFRNQLADTQDPARKRKFRGFKRRDGQSIIKKGRPIPGPYTPEYRKHLLRELLRLQREIQAEGPDPDMALISAPELHEIRRIWHEDFSDWEDSVPRIYSEVMGHHLNWIEDDLGGFGSREYELLASICENQAVPTEMIARLLDVERSMQGMSRRAGIFTRIDQILREEWRDEETILSDYDTEKSRRDQIGLD